MNKSHDSDQSGSPDDIAGDGGSLVDPRYYADGVRWEEDTYRTLRRSRSIAWAITGVFGATTMLSLSCLALLLPLKQFEPMWSRSIAPRATWRCRARSNRAISRRMRP